MPTPPPPVHSRWKKGQSGNPAGGRKTRPALRALKALTIDELVEVGTLVVKGSVNELRAILKDPNSTALKCMMASIAVRAITKGDSHALDALLNRLVGKAPDLVVHSGRVDSDVNAKLTAVDPVKLRAAVEKLRSDF